MKKQWTRTNAGVCQLAVTMIVLIAGGRLNAAEQSDLKSFNSEESYVVEGAAIQRCNGASGLWVSQKSSNFSSKFNCWPSRRSRPSYH